MQVNVGPGTYVLAVSGGVDSVSLLHALKEQPGVKLVVAHYDHGIRADSRLDRQLVQTLAQKYGLPFVYYEGNLGSGASEAEARQARYDFLRHVQASAQAQAIITAHHQDDVIETAIINMLRGTGRKGLASLRSHRHLVRPLLTVPKKDVLAYAKDQGLVWREDSTNQDTKLLRNYVRKVIVPRLGEEGRKVLLNHISQLSVVNSALDADLHLYLHVQPSRQALDRHMFTQLPHVIALEVMAQWLRSHGITTFDGSLLERLTIASKTLEPGKRMSVDATTCLRFGKETIAFLKTYT